MARHCILSPALCRVSSRWPRTSLWYMGRAAASFISLADVLEKGSDDANSLFAELRHRVMSPEDMEVIHNAGQVDQQNQWCTSEFGWDELQAHNRPFRLIKRFVITQASGKKRVIDDAASGGQSLLSQDGNKLQFCSALQPCAHVQTLAATTLHHFGAEAKLHEQVVTCGEDLQMPTVRSRWIRLHPGRVLCATRVEMAVVPVSGDTIRCFLDSHLQ